MAIQLTKERFEATPHGGLISWGVIENTPDGCFMSSDGDAPMLLWGAWKGWSDDWAIYVFPWQEPVYCIADRMESVHFNGNKVIDAINIDRMVHADPEVNARYRR